MRIVSPLNTAAEVDALVDAGANEFYAGLLPAAWKERFSHCSPINRREWPQSNFATAEELGKAIERAHERGAPVNLTMNAHYYTQGQYPVVLNELERALDLGIDALIVGDIGLMLTLREQGLPARLHVSTVGTTFNSRTAQLYEELGAARLVLPRHFTLPELERLRASTTLELELFIINALCSFIDGLCTFQHALDVEGYPDLYLGADGCHACRLKYEVEAHGPEAETARKHYRGWKSLLTEGNCHFCGACAIWELDRIGMDSVKIIGRIHDTERKLRDLSLIAWARDLLTEGLTKKDYIERVMARYAEVYGFPCGRRCYYPTAV